MDTTLRDQLAATHRSAFSSWLDAVDGLDDGAWGTPTGCPGWDVHDQLAHVVSLERLMLGDLWPDLQLPEGLPHVRNDFGRVTEIGVHVRRSLPHDALLQEANDTFERRLVALEALDPATLGEQMAGPGGLQMKGSQLLRTRLFDTVSHEHDVRRALSRPRDAAAHDRIGVEQVLRAWARALPASGLRAGVLVVEVPQVLDATIDLGAGAFAAVDDATAAADARLTLCLSASDVLALGGGRTDAPTFEELAGRGDVRGDLDAARDLLAAAAITP